MMLTLSSMVAPEVVAMAATNDDKFSISNILGFQCSFVVAISSGGRLNKKDGLTRYGNSHVKDKTS